MPTKLRPVVHVTPTATGLHFRGWTSSFTVEAGAGLARLWERLAGPLAAGVEDSWLTPAQHTPAPVAAAIASIMANLRDHDMLVTVPPGWGEPGPGMPAPKVAAWLESSAADPAAAWALLRAVTVDLDGPGPLVEAARRSLAATGVRVGSVGPGTELVLVAGDLAVRAGCAGETGFVTVAGTKAEAQRTAAAVWARLGVEPAACPPDVLAALVGSAAVHRVVCAAAGMSDPADEAAESSTSTGPREPARVLVATLEPFQARYHPMPHPEATPAEAVAFADALAAIEVAADPVLGAWPPVELGDLPQVPASLAVCAGTLGVGTTADAARLDAALRHAGATAPAGVQVGADGMHARGLVLRVAARGRLLGDAGPVADTEWAADPTARRWWKALTLRYAVPASVRIARLTEHAVHAEISAGGRGLAWAVERTAADAVAFATLAAVGVEQARRAGVSSAPVLLSGAAPAWTPESTTDVPWQSRDWHWPHGVRDGEERLQSSLIEVLGTPLASTFGRSAGIAAYAPGAVEVRR
ncbi:hypothetical protein ACFPM7_16600 [Actinokineospora guangxiensis]|uniref:Uncharacterized protein n=1 Tax=Actinokineospora guangxiensis TaxID=1490288 RepID=A0ABW0EPC0_9PSEU